AVRLPLHGRIQATLCEYIRGLVLLRPVTELTQSQLPRLGEIEVVKLRRDLVDDVPEELVGEHVGKVVGGPPRVRARGRKGGLRDAPHPGRWLSTDPLPIGLQEADESRNIG